MQKVVLFTQDPFLTKTFIKNHGYLKDFHTVSSMDALLSFRDENTCVLYDFAGDHDALESLASRMNVFVLSQNPTFMEGSLLLDYNIRGYANRYISKLHLQQAFTLIDKGHVWLYPAFISEMIVHIKNKNHVNEKAFALLTTREREIALDVKSGMSNEQIKEKLNLTYNTVKSHISSIYQKVGVNNRFSLALKLA